MDRSLMRYRSRSAGVRLILVPLLAMALTFGMAATVQAQEENQEDTKADEGGLMTLVTATPEEGFALAVKLSQKAVGTTQTDANVRQVLRGAYAHDPDSLIAVSQVVAINFQTISAANNYWRE
ncbi:hexameric tyrosine-coordinated heme protein [Thiohalomonas denitrificans]|uniref:Hexameric tyrosine-coordinated heme protein (HTHP) n=1 Tax=Thiohalomonas denitrificans TaxID=415747 RepID=A0A1G5QBJ1_9GAMM|nr:hexameric tyrosine-coordinated heme protein [Thiohalomonas denitrificans]SCZ59233.1 Hexameric tyrosine-coordinated heme protein (HTHP) [Thiohalomonas denitrificans]